jgi:cellulose synthase (UDP-forming)
VRSHPAAGWRQDRQPNIAREIGLTVAALAVTALATALFVATALDGFLVAAESGRTRFATELALFVLLAGALVYGNLCYQIARLGYLRRLRGHSATPERDLDDIYDGHAPAVQILVPAYQEERRIVRQTLLSAALQPYPARRLTLLIDDRPMPRTAQDMALLNGARSLVGELSALLAGRAAAAESARSTFLANPPATTLARRRAARELADHFDGVAAFFEALASAEPARDHTDALFIEQILRRPAADYRARAASLRARARALRGPSLAQLRRGYGRLAAQFSVPISAFERKRYANLSHEPNKAMNLNAFIALMGRRWREVEGDGALQLEPAAADAPADLEVPDADAVVTLDADSLLLPDYVLRLMRVMYAPGNERVAVIQTPYSAVPGASSALEQVAGATTDIQYLIHQGFTRHDATFWVGANAVIRKRALEEIASSEVENGHAVRRYIQDRTVIEDTESTVDLVSRGWRLVNYPARLSFSATPPDFGSLIIQRRRWANGGLIILPKLLRHLWNGLRGRRPAVAEGFMRVHYLISIAATNVALLVMLAYPFPDGVATIWLPLAAAPYFVLYARDLSHAGYRARDMLRVYALNLLLLPVNLAGAAKSIQQGITRRKIPFGRTPKIDGRTAAPALYLLAAPALALFWLTGALNDAGAGRSLHALFAALNAGLLIYAIGRFVGWRALVSDLRAQLRWPELRPLRSAIASARLSIFWISRLR